MTINEAYTLLGDIVHNAWISLDVDDPTFGAYISGAVELLDCLEQNGAFEETLSNDEQTNEV